MTTSHPDIATIESVVLTDGRGYSVLDGSFTVHQDGVEFVESFMTGPSYVAEVRSEPWFEFRTPLIDTEAVMFGATKSRTMIGPVSAIVSIRTNLEAP